MAYVQYMVTMLSNNGLCAVHVTIFSNNGLCGVHVTVFSTDGKFQTVSDFAELHALTQAAHSYSLLLPWENDTSFVGFQEPEILSTKLQIWSSSSTVYM